MALHIMKLVVGVERVEELEAYGQAMIRRDGAWRVQTRSTPTRAAEVLDGGSLYRVIKGVMGYRQTILAIDTIGDGAAKRCLITVDPQLVPVTPTPRRPFQGWRYLQAEAAPADLITGDLAYEAPPALVLQLRELGLW
jgi:hypothetical protein